MGDTHCMAIARRVHYRPGRVEFLRDRWLTSDCFHRHDDHRAVYHAGNGSCHYRNPHS